MPPKPESFPNLSGQLVKEYQDPWNRLVVDLDCIRSNYQWIRSQVAADLPIYAVVKSDAYGHGMREVAGTLQNTGCGHFAVETVREAMVLRNEGISEEILLLNPIPLWEAEMAVRHDLSITVIHPSIIQPIQEAATELGTTGKIHFNLNAGLHRMGIAPSRLIKIAREVAGMSHLEIRGIYAQPRDPETAHNSYEILKKHHRILKKEGIPVGPIHFANSTTFLESSTPVVDGLRIGILLYGVLPPEQHKAGVHIPALRPALTLTSRIVQIRSLEKGQKIGYHSRERTMRDSLIGTLPIGYSHGLERKIGKHGRILFRDSTIPFIGTISMNACTVDLTEFPDARVGEEVVIIGRKGNQLVKINDMAEKADTIAAELMTKFGRAVSRTYKDSMQDNPTLIHIVGSDGKKMTLSCYQQASEMPSWLSVRKITRFLGRNLTPFEDTQETIFTAVDYALSPNPHKGGFVLIAHRKKKIVGVLVCVQRERTRFLPRNLLVYICIHEDFRRKGLGTRLVREALNITGGDMKLHLLKRNPVFRFFNRMGFTDSHLELRYTKRREQ